MTAPTTTPLDGALHENDRRASIADAVSKAVMLEQGLAGKASPHLFDAYQEANAALTRSIGKVLHEVATSRLMGQQVHTVDGPLFVLHASRIGGALLIEDNGPVKPGWHEGPRTGTDVRYEVWEYDSEWTRVAHGYRDSDSRKIVQVG